MLSGDWSSASGDMKYLICQVTSQKLVKERSRNFMSRSSLWYVTNLPGLLAIYIYYTSRNMFLVCQVIKQDHLIKESSDYKNRDPKR